MTNLYTYPLKLTVLSFILLLLSSQAQLHAQACTTAQGDQNTYGTNNIWIGYVYTGQSFNNYQGYVNEGTSASANFDESFGGGGVNYNTNGCSIITDNFSVRYKLQQTVANASYQITVGGDDGFRFSLDGGATWIINMWQDQSYTTSTINITLSGTYNMVLEYYQNGGDNRVSFNMTQVCMGTDDQTIYGTNNVWKGYLYQGMNFDVYKGLATEGSSSSPAFDENFGNPGGSNSNIYNTSACTITTFQFSARYRLQQVLPAGSYSFTAGGDDGYRLSIDGGSTWIINNWNDHAYVSTTYTTTLPAGTYNTVLEYYQNGGFDEVMYSNTYTVLPVTLSTWTATLEPGDKALLKWTTSDAVGFDHFNIQRSTDGVSYDVVGTVAGVSAYSTATQQYAYTDQFNYDGNVFYRLQMVDRDGTTRYSAIAVLPMQAADAVRIYPTVVENGDVTVESPGTIDQARLELYDMNGHKLMVRDWSQLQGRQQVAITASTGHLPAGVYILRLSDPQSLLAKQVIIIK